MATIARAWEKQSGQLRDELATLRDEMRRRLESMSGDRKQDLAAVTASCETRLQTQVSNTSREVGQDLVSVRHEVQSLLDRRTYVAAAAIGVSLVLGVYGLMGRTSPSAADDHRVDRETRTERVADALPPQSPTSAGNEQQAATSPSPETPAVSEGNAQATAQEPSSADQGIDHQTSPFPASAATTPQESPLAGEAESSADPPSDPLPGTRVWTDHKGRSAEAEFEDFRDGTVYLRSPGTGRVHPIPLEQFSVPDQAYVRGSLAWRR